jgi:hypothetical protein
MRIPKRIRASHKIVGYFSYTDTGQVFCDGDACIIAGSRAKMQSYLEQMPNGDSRDLIKKTRFGEVIEGLRQGGAYAFDEKAYAIFSECAKNNNMISPSWQDQFKDSPEVMCFIRIQALD